MPYRWKDTNQGGLKVQQGKRGKKAIIVGPGGVIPSEYISEELLKRFPDQIEEVEKVIKKPKPIGPKVKK